jgi:hypothetical protein
LLPFTFRQVDVSPIEFQALPGPEARALRAKTMRRASFLGPGGQFKCGMPIAECGLKKKTKKSEIRNPQSEITGPMLFPRNALTSGPQACFFPRKRIEKVKVGKAARTLVFL